MKISYPSYLTDCVVACVIRRRTAMYVMNILVWLSFLKTEKYYIIKNTTDGFILRTINPWQSSDIIFTFTYVKLVEQELLALLEYLSSPSRFYVVSVAHVQLVEQERLALLEYLSSPPRFYMVSVAHVQLV